MGVRFITSHIIVCMIASNHHDRHQGDMFVALCFQLRDDIFQIRTAFDRVNEDIVHAEFMQTILDDAVVSVARMWSAVSHDQGSVLFTHLRELGGQSFQEVNDLIRFAFGALEVHQWGSEGDLLEMRNLHLGDDGVIGIFHAWDDVEGNDSDTGVAFILQFLESFFRGHFLDAFIGFHTVDNDMGSVCFEYRYIRMSFLDGCFYSIDSFSSCIGEGGTEGHDEDSIFVWCILHSRVFCSPYTDGGSFAKSRGYILDFRIQFICIGGHAETKYTQSCHRCRQNSFQTFFHEKSLL